MDVKKCLNYFYNNQNTNSPEKFLNAKINVSNLLFDNDKFQKGHSYHSKKNAKEQQKNRLFRSSSVLNNLSNKKYTAKFKIKQKKNPKDFYITESKNITFDKPKTNSLIISSLTKYNINQNKESLLDKIHNKEIDLCMGLMKNLSEKNTNRNISLKLNDSQCDEYNEKEETHNIIQKLKNFNLISNKIMNNYQRIPISLDNLSMSTYYKTNNANNTSNSLCNNLNFNMSNYSLINSMNQTEMKNTTIDASKSIIKSKIIKSYNNLYKNMKPISNYIVEESNNNNSNPKNDINFHTGFIRHQKYIDIYSKLGNQSLEPYHRKRNMYEDKKLGLAEIDEYRAIIENIENKKNKFHRSQSVLENKDKNEIVIKDRLTEELNEMYSKQKKLFLDYIKEKADPNNKSKLYLYKEEVNKNIRQINKNKRIPNSFIDGYSLFDGKTNKTIEQYNYILGDKFHDKFQKSIKEKKLLESINELDDKYKRNIDELLVKYHAYKKLFEPKLYSDNVEKEEHNEVYDLNLDFRKINNYLITKDSDIKEAEKEAKKIEDTTTSKKEKIYKEYMEFKNQYVNKYLTKSDNNEV